jgi:hypothetical protein
MSNQPDTDPQPQPEGEPLIEMKRSLSHVAVQAVETIAAGAGVTLGGLAAKDAYAAAKDKFGSKDDGSKSNDSKD